MVPSCLPMYFYFQPVFTYLPHVSPPVWLRPASNRLPLGFHLASMARLQGAGGEAPQALEVQQRFGDPRHLLLSRRRGETVSRAAIGEGKGKPGIGISEHKAKMRWSCKGNGKEAKPAGDLFKKACTQVFRCPTVSASPQKTIHFKIAHKVMLTSPTKKSEDLDAVARRGVQAYPRRSLRLPKQA